MVARVGKGHFAKGQSGNPSGKSRLKPLTDRLRATLAQHPERAQRIAEALIEEAEKGNLTATNMIFDRLEGRPTQAVEISDSRQMLEMADIDQRIKDLSRRLGTPTPLIDSTAEDADLVDDGTRH